MLDEDIAEILSKFHKIAMVGLSNNPDKPSYQVAEYLKANGYRVIPVNPAVAEIQGEKSYPSLAAIPEPIEIVDIFRRSEDIPPIVDAAILVKAKVVWMQLGIENEPAANKARQAGLKVVMNRCMKREHQAIQSQK
ncbi:MAG: CoA-binding domain protein [Dehalococcoidia bacterium]|nr:CoA-binding domain protein [Dehalococcoidia bacterium]